MNKCFLDTNFDNFFNASMSYRRNAEYFHPYGILYQTKPHPTGKDLKNTIQVH